jgi:hypothetical protein
MGMIRFKIPKEAMVHDLFVNTRYGQLPLTSKANPDLAQWAINNHCKIALSNDFQWYIDIPEEGNAALEYKLAWL